MKKILLILSFLLFYNYIFCSYIDSNTAKIVAKNFYISRLLHVNNSSLKSTLLEDVSLDLVHQEFEISPDSIGNNKSFVIPYYYVFNVNYKSGFVIVSADDRIQPILGYSFSGQFSNKIQPPAYKAWMNAYKSQIKKIIQNDSSVNELNKDWIQYQNSNIKSEKRLKAVAPLITTGWNQDDPYNNYCPDDVDGSGGHAYAGCVATAMAQIIRYWEHPDICDTIRGYNSDYGWILEIPPTTYDYLEMPDTLSDSSSTSEINAVSQLIYHCAVAARMDFSPDGSTASISEARDGLINSFGYSSTAKTIQKIYYSTAEWQSLLINELDNNRPIIYSGDNNLGNGHAFICAGYQDTNYFYMNWGWGGYEDGYFYLDDLTPGEKLYNYDHWAVIYTYPDNSSICSDPLEPNNLYTEAYDIDTNTSYTNNNLCLTPLDDDWFKFNYNGASYFFKVMGPSYDNYGAYGLSFSIINNIISIETIQINELTDTKLYFWDLSISSSPIADDDDGGNECFSKIIYTIPSDETPELEISNYSIDDDNNNSSGDDDTLPEPGETIELTVTLINNGSATANNVSAILSTSDSDITINDNSGIFGEIEIDSSRSTNEYSFTISSTCTEKDVPFNLSIISDEGSWIYQFTIHIYHEDEICVDSLEPNDLYTQANNIGADTSYLDSNLCLTALDEDWFNFIYKDSVFYFKVEGYSESTKGAYGISFNRTNANIEIETFDVSGTTDTKLYLYDSDHSTELAFNDDSTGYFSHIEYTINLELLPVIEYYDHIINDNNNGNIEAGETIEIYIRLINTGEIDVNNVSAILSTSDPNITFIDNVGFYDSIEPDSTALSEDKYQIKVSPDCEEIDITFSLLITSDEGTWTDTFTLHIKEITNSILNNQKNNFIKIYPNPSIGEINLEGYNVNNIKEIQVLSLDGTRTLVTRNVSHEKLDISSLNNGIYILRVISDNTIINKRIILIK